MEQGLGAPVVDEESRRRIDVVLGDRPVAADADGAVEEADVERGHRDGDAIADARDLRTHRVLGQGGSRGVEVGEREGLGALEPAGELGIQGRVGRGRRRVGHAGSSVGER